MFNHMTKFLSLFLSCSLLFSTVVPSYGQALAGPRRPLMSYAASDEMFFPSYGADSYVLSAEQNMAFTQAFEQAQFRFYSQDLTQLREKVNAAVSVLTESQEPDDYEWFKEYYTETLRSTFEMSLSLARSAEEKETLRKVYESQTSESSVREMYEKFWNGATQPTAGQGEQYIKDLGRQIYEKGKRNYQSVLDLIEEALPVFASAGLLDPGVKKWAAGVLRQEVRSRMSSCEALGWVPGLLGRQDKKAQECESVLKSASALIVLGENGNSQDARVISDLLKTGHNGILGPSVIILTGTGLLAMGAEDLLVAVLSEVARQQPRIGILGRDFSFISIQDWVKAVKSLLEAGDWAVGHEYSFYRKTEGKALGNVWMDLGEYLGEAAVSNSKEGRRAADALDRLAGQLLVVGKDGSVFMQFPVFMAGALAGGYRVKNMARAGWELDGNGQGHYVDTRANWQALEQRLQQWGETLTGYTIARLYFAGKSDLDPYTKVDIENHLALGYKKNGGGAIKEIAWRSGPSDKEINQYQNWNRAMRLGGQVDTALAVVGILAAGVGLVKAGASGVRALNQMGRVFKLARSGAAGSGLKATLNSYNRIVRLGRLQKYGVSSWRQAFVSKMAGLETAASEQSVSKTLKAVASSSSKADILAASNAAKSIGTAPRSVPSASLSKTTVVSATPSQQAVSAVVSPANKPIASGGEIFTPKAGVYKKGSMMTPQLREALQKKGGERLVQAVEGKGNPASASASKGTVGGKKAPKQTKAQNKAKKANVVSEQTAQPAVLARGDAGFLNQKPDVLVNYLRRTYNLTPDSLKDIKRVLVRIETLSDGPALKRAVFERVEQLLKMKQDILASYAASTGRPRVHPGVRVYYLGDKEAITAASFQPKHITLALEEVLQPGTLREFSSIASRVNNNRSLWTMNTKGSASIVVQRGKRITPKDVSQLYQHVLNCSFKQPCRYLLDENGTVLFYPPQGRTWLRVGEHEVANKFHLHIHTDKYIPVAGGIRNGQERIILNYRVPMVNVDKNFRALSRAKGHGYTEKHIPVRQTEAYRVFVSGALEDMVRTGAAVSLQ